jgi:hypothetical protein
LRNIVRIVTETGRLIYKELTPMKKDHVDLDPSESEIHLGSQNALVRPASLTFRRSPVTRRLPHSAALAAAHPALELPPR